MNFELLNVLALTSLTLIFLAIQRTKLPTFEKKSFPLRKRFEFFDFVKGVAILLVVVFHVFFSSRSDYPYPMLASTVVRFMIPVFFLSSGALLWIDNTGKRELKSFYRKKFLRVILPYLPFSALATFVFADFNNSFEFTFLVFWQAMTGTAFAPYYFIIVLIQLYLIYPILWHILYRWNMKPAIFLTAGFAINLASLIWVPNYTSLPVFFGKFLFFMCLGMVLRPILLSESREWLKKIRIVPWALVITFLYLWIASLNPTEIYTNAQLIYGPTVFLLLFYLYPKMRTFNNIHRFFLNLGEKSLYIYLIHYFIVILLPPFQPTLLSFFMNTLVVLSLTYGMILLIEKVKTSTSLSC